MGNIFEVNGRKNIVALVLSIIIAEGTGYLSSFLSGNIPETFKLLNKPTFTPPTWVFPVVWIILYFFMAVAVYRIWLLNERGINVTKALVLYAVQLILNFLWTIIFFRFKLFWIAFMELLLLVIFVILTTIEFKKFDRISFLLMIPYLIWIIFAGALNYSIWMMN